MTPTNRSLNNEQMKDKRGNHPYVYKLMIHIIACMYPGIERSSGPRFSVFMMVRISVFFCLFIFAEEINVIKNVHSTK